jgi:hypothetical protein
VTYLDVITNEKWCILLVPASAFLLILDAPDNDLLLV